MDRVLDRLRWRLRMIRLGFTLMPMAGGDETPEEKAAREKAEADKAAADAAAEAAKKPPWGSEEDFNAERAWELIQGLRADKDKLKGERDAANQKLTKLEEASQTEEQKREKRAKDAEQQAQGASSDANRLRVALRKGLTETQAKRLVGENEEELEKDADELLASFKSEDEPVQEPGRRPKERLRPGAAPSANSEPSDPAKLAEQVPRGW